MLDLSISAVGKALQNEYMTINNSNMPDNWTVVDQNPEISQSVNIDPEGNEWIPNLLVTIPSDAEGSETGSFLVTMTLDSNPSISKAFLFQLK